VAQTSGAVASLPLKPLGSAVKEIGPDRRQVHEAFTLYSFQNLAPSRGGEEVRTQHHYDKGLAYDQKVMNAKASYKHSTVNKINKGEIAYKIVRTTFFIGGARY